MLLFVVVDVVIGIYWYIVIVKLDIFIFVKILGFWILKLIYGIIYNRLMYSLGYGLKKIC